MRQINVYPETHQLAKELSLKTGKNMNRVVKEALEAYGQSLSNSNLLLNKFLEQVTETIVDAVKQYVIREVPVAVEAVAKELLAAEKEELERIALDASNMLSPAEQEEIDSY